VITLLAFHSSAIFNPRNVNLLE